LKQTAIAGLLLVAQFSLAAKLRLASELRESGYQKVELRQTADRQLFLWGHVNGERQSILVDTGWSHTTIAHHVSGTASNLNEIASLQLGGIAFTNLQVQGQKLTKNGKPASYQLILGAKFLSANHGVLDFAKQRLYLRDTPIPGSARIKLEAALRQAGWIAVTLKRREPAAWTCTAIIGDEQVNLLLDSGAPWSCLNASTVQRLGIPTQPSLSRISGPAMQSTFIQVSPKLDIDLEGFQPQKFSFAVFDLTELGLGSEGWLYPDVTGILGAAELMRHKAVLDCESNKLWLCR